MPRPVSCQQAQVNCGERFSIPALFLYKKLRSANRRRTQIQRFSGGTMWVVIFQSLPKEFPPSPFPFSSKRTSASYFCRSFGELAPSSSSTTRRGSVPQLVRDLLRHDQQERPRRHLDQRHRISPHRRRYGPTQIHAAHLPHQIAGAYLALPQYGRSGREVRDRENTYEPVCATVELDSHGVREEDDRSFRAGGDGGRRGGGLLRPVLGHGRQIWYGLERLLS
mmetsp:Transcript_23414/g.56533  ORF Transcript_23414/g.56533 Transcript_23414/m.56533 type:complete len:223 (-) Transcript_23414:885-1553(-)